MKAENPGWGAPRIQEDKSARRRVALTDRVRTILEHCRVEAGGPQDGWVFPAADPDKPFNYRSLDSQHDRLVAKLKFTGRMRLYTSVTRPYSSC